MSAREKLKNFQDPTSVFNLAWKGRAKGLKLFLPSSYCTFEKACKRPPMTVAVNQLLEPSTNCIKILTLKVCRYSSEGGWCFSENVREAENPQPLPSLVILPGNSFTLIANPETTLPEVWMCTALCCPYWKFHNATVEPCAG